jgi:glycine betaine/proline transport system substrate-binding protein
MTIGMIARAMLLCGAATVGAFANSADVAACDISRPIMFAGLDYGSAAFHTAVASHILKEGYRCSVDSLPGGTIPLQQAVVRGDLDIVMEVWTANPTQVWQDGMTAGKAVQLGTTFPDAVEGWWVPRYLVEGPDASAPNLKSVADLADYKHLFADPEEPGKGRFYNCPAGWNCEVVNSRKLVAYDLEEYYTNFRPGTGASLSAAAESAFRRKKPIVLYYWTPTWLMGKFDFIKLDEPAYDQTVWDAMMASDEPDAATEYPVTAVVIGANKAFSESAPTITRFLNAYGMSSALTGQALAYMQDNDATADAAALRFLKQHPDVWTAWIDEDVATKVKASLQ